MLDAFGITTVPEPDLTRWKTVMDRITHPEGEVKIAVVGKYTGLLDAYKSLNEALVHGGVAYYRCVTRVRLSSRPTS